MQRRSFEAISSAPGDDEESVKCFYFFTFFFFTACTVIASRRQFPPQLLTSAVESLLSPRTGVDVEVLYTLHFVGQTAVV